MCARAHRHILPMVWSSATGVGHVNKATLRQAGLVLILVTVPEYTLLEEDTPANGHPEAS